MAGFKEFDRFDALGLAALVRSGEVAASEVLEAAIERVEARNPWINAVVLRMYDEARTAVRGKRPAGPLAGVPYLLKDLGALAAGTVTTGGSAFFRDAVAGHDSEIVARMRRAGLVIFGKTNTSELGLSTSVEPRLFGPTRNPWAPERSAGGSSGGAAAAVAAGMVPAAHASDGGGSIRIPASACGLFGLKPTRARTPVGPDLGESWNGAGSIHAITRTVRDSAAILDATAGPEVGDPYFAPPQQQPFLAEVDEDPGRLKIAFTTRPWNDHAVDAACAAAVHSAARICEQLGHLVEEARPEWDEPARAAAMLTIVGAHTRATLEVRGEAIGRPPGPEDVEPGAWVVAELGRQRTAAEYARAIGVMHAMGRALGRFFADWDVLLTPTMCSPPHPLGVLSLSTRDPRAYRDAIQGSTAFTAPFNGSGNPAMSVPLYWTQGGLPIGVQFVAPFGGEAVLFRLAGQLERAQPWAQKRPL